MRSAVVVEPGVANLDVTRAVDGRGVLLRARPVEPAGLHDRRQRRGELGRRPLPEERLHRSSRDRIDHRAARRRARGARRQGARSGRLRPTGGVRRLGGHAGDRHARDAAGRADARAGADAAGRVPLHRRRGCGRVGDRRLRDRARCDRDDGPAGRPRPPSSPSRPATPPERGRCCSWSWTGSRAGRRRRGAGSATCSTPCGAFEVRAASDEAERALLWKGRKGAFPAMGRVSPQYYVQDGVVPRTRLPEVLRRIDALSTEYGLRVGNVFHAGDGNLHPLVLYDDAAGETERAKELAEAIPSRVHGGRRGSLTGEHGVGVDKACSMPQMFSELRPRGVRPAAPRLRPGRAREPGQGDPDPSPLRRGARPRIVFHPLEALGVGDRF